VACFWFEWTEPGIAASTKIILGAPIAVLEPQSSTNRSFTSRLYCTERALWKLYWFLRDFGYDVDLLQRDQVDEKALLNLAASFVHRIRPFARVVTKILTPSHPLVNGKYFLARQPMSSTHRMGAETPMVYSYTQISQYLRCPRSYRYATSVAGGKRRHARYGFWPLF